MAGGAGGNVDAIMRQPGQGCALYTSIAGQLRLVVSYGNRRADLPGLPPSNYGSMTLAGYTGVVGARGTEDPAEMISPLKRALEYPETHPQVPSPWAREPGGTEYPEVLVHGRNSSSSRRPDLGAAVDRRQEVFQERPPAERAPASSGFWDRVARRMWR
jgi:hypothetical protein